jgi:hypothetical protein
LWRIKKLHQKKWQPTRILDRSFAGVAKKELVWLNGTASRNAMDKSSMRSESRVCLEKGWKRKQKVWVQGTEEKRTNKTKNVTTA